MSSLNNRELFTFYSVDKSVEFNYPAIASTDSCIFAVATFHNLILILDLEIPSDLNCRSLFFRETEMEGEIFTSCAGIMITYNELPDSTTINRALGSIGAFIIVDNSTDSQIIRKLDESIGQLERVKIVHNRMNLGISRAINIGLKEAKNLGKKFVFILDGDARVNKEYFSECYRTWIKLEKQNIKVGIVCPIVMDEGLVPSLNFSNGFSYIKDAINSGIMTSVEVFEETGGFDEGLFVESADFSFTDRVRGRGYRICRVNKILIEQTFGIRRTRNSLLLALLDRVSLANSIVSLRTNTMNVFMRRYPLYKPERRQEYYSSMAKLNSGGLNFQRRTRVAMSKILDSIAYRAYSKLISKGES